MSQDKPVHEDLQLNGRICSSRQSRNAAAEVDDRRKV